MTSYHGGKQRIGKRIANIIYDESIDIEDEYEFTIKGYCEPFCGMLGVYQHIPELFKDHKPKLKYKAGDMNKSVIAMWKAAQKGWKPPTKMTEKEYNRLKKSKRHSSLKGFVGHQYSFRGIFFGGFQGRYDKKKTSAPKAAKRVTDIAKKLKDISFSSGNYTSFSNLKGYIIYCDPPYFGTSQRYKNKFDSSKFWDWCRKMAKHNVVFVSEYLAPKDFECIFSSTHKITGFSPTAKVKRAKRTEKLYIIF